MIPCPLACGWEFATELAARAHAAEDHGHHGPVASAPQAPMAAAPERPCPFARCTDTFTSRRQLARHLDRDHGVALPADVDPFTVRIRTA